MQPDDGRVISNLIVQALHGKTLFMEMVNKPGVCYVDDLIEGMMLAMNSHYQIY